MWACRAFWIALWRFIWPFPCSLLSLPLPNASSRPSCLIDGMCHRQGLCLPLLATQARQLPMGPSCAVHSPLRPILQALSSPSKGFAILCCNVFIGIIKGINDRLTIRIHHSTPTTLCSPQPCSSVFPLACPHDYPSVFYPPAAHFPLYMYILPSRSTTYPPSRRPFPPRSRSRYVSRPL